MRWSAVGGSFTIRIQRADDGEIGSEGWEGEEGKEGEEGEEWAHDLAIYRRGQKKIVEILLFQVIFVASIFVCDDYI